MGLKKYIALLALSVSLPIAAFAEHNSDDLAKKLANPVASLISVPFQFNYDRDIGANEQGVRTTLNIQPVLPFELNDDWNLISRTIFSVMDQKDVALGSQSGLGDTVQTLFFSPSKSSGGLIWGVGPVFLLPTATDELLGGEKWGVGPSAVLIQQEGSYNLVLLANYIKSFAGDKNRADISSAFVNPVVSKNIPGGWTFGVQLEHTFDLESDHDSGVGSAFISKVTQISGQTLSFSLVPKYWYETTDNSPKGFALRGSVVFIFPR